MRAGLVAGIVARGAPEQDDLRVAGRRVPAGGGVRAVTRTACEQFLSNVRPVSGFVAVRRELRPGAKRPPLPDGRIQFPG